MSKRPRIKQADGSLLDLPLDAETIKGKKLEEIALKTDIPTRTSQLNNDSGFLTKLPDNVVTKDKDGNILLNDKCGLSNPYGTSIWGFNDAGEPTILSKEGRYFYIATTEIDDDYCRYYFPEYDGEVVVKNEHGSTEINKIYNISSLDGCDEKSGIIFGNIGYEVLLYSEEAKIGLATPDMIDGGDVEHFIHFPDTGRTGDGTFNSYEWYLPAYGGTILTASTPIFTDENITTTKNLVVFSDDDSDSELQPKNNDDIDATYYSKGIRLYNNDTGEEHRLYYPEKTGTIALLEDLENIGGGGASGATQLKLVATGTPTSTEYFTNYCTYSLDTNLKENTLYVVKRIEDAGYGATSSCVGIMGTEIPIALRDTENDNPFSGNLILLSNSISIQANTPFYNDQNDEIYVYEVQGGTSASNGTSSGGLKLVESGNSQYDETELVLQSPLEKNKVYVINLTLADGLFSFIVNVFFNNMTSSTRSWYSAEGIDIELTLSDDLKTIKVAEPVTGRYCSFGEGTYEIYELAGGTSSAGAKLRKENYIEMIKGRGGVVSDFERGSISEEPFIAFTQPVDIVVETPRTKTFKTNTASKPSLYRPIGGERVFTEREYLTFADIFQLLNTDLSTIGEVYNPSQTSGRGARYLVFRDNQYSVENRLNALHTYGWHNKEALRDFLISERWVSKQMTFILKPVINYEEIENDYGNHYTYLTGSHAIEIQIVLSYDDRDVTNPNNHLQYLINYKIVELD